VNSFPRAIIIIERHVLEFPMTGIFHTQCTAYWH